ncbi:MAG TPA: ABC transporter permease [Terriglobia bacterium]|nr:ABC transporter permease [Terriglobia bacterium]
MSRRKRMMENLDQDIRDFIERETQDNIERGMPPEEARYAALRKFGNVTRVREETREVWSRVWLEQLCKDVCFGVRMLAKTPAFTAVAVMTLALGIGANTAIFSVVEGVLWAPLPYAQSDRLVAVWESHPHAAHVWISYPNFQDWQRNAHSFEQVVAFASEGLDLTSPGTPEHLEGEFVSAGFFRTLGARLALGREFSTQEDQGGGAPVAILSNRVWRNRFAGSPEVVGKLVTLDGVGCVVVGVLPAEFHFEADPDVYRPIGQGDPLFLNNRAIHPGILAIGRLRTGVTLLQAQAEMRSIQKGLDQLYPDADRDLGTDVVPLKQEMVGNVGRTLLLVFGAVGIVLLIACANFASLLLAHSASRTRELAVRLALGASPARVVRQLLTESVLLSLAGGGAGLLMAVWGVRPVLAAVPGSLPRAESIGVNVPVLLFAMGISIAVGLLSGLAPALKSSKANLDLSLKEGSRRSTGGHYRAQGGLVIVQLALTLVLLVGAGLLLRTIRQMWDVNPGFDMRNLITFKVGLSPQLIKAAEGTRVTCKRLMDGIRQILGVEAADFTNQIPLSGEDNDSPFWIGSHQAVYSQTAPRLNLYWTGPDYLQTMRIRLLRGRLLTREDTTSSPPVIVVDKAFADTWFPGRDSVGKTITIAYWGTVQIVGVVGHVKHWGLGDVRLMPPSQPVYASFYQLPDRYVPAFSGYLTAVVRTPFAPSVVIPAIKLAVYETGKDQPVYNSRTMDEIASESISRQRFPMILLVVFASLALLLASVGIYGVVSYSVAQRVHEIGIRLALGAERGEVLRLVLGQGAKMALLGVGIGLASAFALARLMAGLLFGVSAHDPLTFFGSAAVLILVALSASYIPARRAMKVDPMVALRYE